jgi:polygalacturonase
LLLEQLESRDLLAVLLPAPPAALLQHPADNPALPAAFDVFNPPVTNIAAAPAAPQLATLTEQGNPDDSLAATGFQFSTQTGASAGQDTVFQVYGQTTAANGTLSNATFQELNGDRAVVTLPSGLPSNSMYLVWAENAAGASVPFAVNRTEAWWIGPNAASPGDTVSVYGQNLSSGNQSWIYLQPSQGHGQWITPSAVNPYKVDFVIPNSLTAGSYQIWVHNGNGGQYGWSGPVTLTVQARYNYGNMVVNLSDYGALPNTGVDAVPAFQAAIKAIGNNGPATIQLQAGTYYLSNELLLTAGFGKGIYLQGAGKNVTFLKPLPGFTDQFFLDPGTTSAVSDLTVDVTGANLTSGIAVVPCPSITNVSVIAHGYSDVNGTNWNNVLLKNDDFVGTGVFFGSSSQVTITGCNFYATDSATALVSIWGGSDINVTNNTAQDFNLNSPNLVDHGTGRFYWGTGYWGSQANVYIGGNTTIHFAPPLNYSNQTSGEQIMWEGDNGLQSSLASSATSTTVTLTAPLGGNYIGDEAVVTAGKGIGQHATIVSTSGSTLTLDSPWAVTPDATSRISIIITVKQVVVYNNNLQGNSNFTDFSASAGVEPFMGGFSFVVDGNTMHDLRFGINQFTWWYTGYNAVLPAYSNLYQNNTIVNCPYGIRSYDNGDMDGEAVTDMGNIYRRNTLSGIVTVGWEVVGGHSPDEGGTMDLDVFEHNSISDAPIGIHIGLPSPAGPTTLVIYKNVINLGTAPSGSQAVATQPGWVLLLSGNTYQNYLTAQGATGTLTSLSPTFTWNAIPGATHYDVWVADLTTGQSPVQRNMNVTGTSWTMTSPLSANHQYRWWVEALDDSGPITPWTSSTDFATVALTAPAPTVPLGTTPFLSAASLQPAFTWSAVAAANSYDVWVNDLTTGQSQVVRQTTTSTSLTSPSSLILGHQYQWWVRALSNGGNSSPWSVGGTFAVVLSSPVLTGPTGALPTAQPTFTWSPVAGANLYDVWVDDTTTGQSQVLRAPLTGNQTVTVNAWMSPISLRPGDSYMWWVRALSNTGAASSWTTGATFTVATLSTPSLLSALGSAQNMVFQWSAVANATYYDVWVDDLTSGTSQVMRNTHVTTNSLSATTLTSGHSYRWWVRAYSDSGNYSAWSAAVNFTVL